MATFLAHGCASIQTIRPVAKLNVQNAEALAVTVPTLVEITDKLLRDRIQVAALARYREIMMAIRKSPYAPPQNTNALKDVAAHYRHRADELLQKIDLVSGDEKVRAIYLANYPITAAVAFGSMSDELAAQIWLTHEATYDMLSSGEMSNAVAFDTRLRVIKDLPAAKEVAQAETDVKEAFGGLRHAIVAQLDNASRLSDELYSASQSSADFGTMVENLLGNENLQSLVATVADSHTKGRTEANQVDSILGSVLDNQSIAGILSGGR